MLKTVREINESSLKMSKLNRLPKVNAFMDLGTQAHGWRYNDDSTYYLVGVQLSCHCFRAFATTSPSVKTNSKFKSRNKTFRIHRRQLELSASLAKNQLQTSIQNYYAAQEQLKSSQSYFNLMEKGYQGRSEFAHRISRCPKSAHISQLQLNLRQLEVLTADAHVERETASYTF